MTVSQTDVSTTVTEDPAVIPQPGSTRDPVPDHISQRVKDVADGLDVRKTESEQSGHTPG